MVNLADLCNDKNKLCYLFEDKLREFCEKYEIHPMDLEVTVHLGGNISIRVKV